jgi:hypothetical protein
LSRLWHGYRFNPEEAYLMNHFSSCKPSSVYPSVSGLGGRACDPWQQFSFSCREAADGFLTGNKKKADSLTYTIEQKFSSKTCQAALAS